MNKNVLFSGLLAAVFIGAVSSPFGVPKAVNTMKVYNTESSRYNTTVDNANRMVENLTQAVTNFNDKRDAEIPFTDISLVCSVLNNTPGLLVSTPTIVDIKSGFSEMGDYTTGDECNAVKLVVGYTELDSALESFYALDLPVYTMSVNCGAKTFEAIVLTGGAY